ncbi:hypothetical protein REC12_25850 [Desulfosporosinus sp. PR]|uniref:DUF6773 family protein n=1 Tax=Candidatus Desulfosporosinus nitrosoreducens TaxID=3401928 RepID=UPI0027F4D66A|nr:DUF6773 family protein [Desulfosporosinus sp. PR]MDQ7097023.1 hypothetical protein [Desulfosporosinus sp. PR]
MRDERIRQAKNKIRSEMATIILLGIAISFSIKTLVFHRSIEECLTEYLILILAPLYQLVRMHMLKVGIYNERGNRQPVKNLLLAMAIFLAASAVTMYKAMKESAVYAWQRSVTFLLVFLVLFVLIFFVTSKFNQYRAHKYEKEFDDD